MNNLSQSWLLDRRHALRALGSCISLPLVSNHDKPMMRCLSLFAVIFSATFASAADWPQWMGPNRDDDWVETGILDTFPADGLKFRWRVPIQGGYSGPAVANGKVFVTDFLKSPGDVKPSPTKLNELLGKERVLCLDAKTGKELWKHEYDCNYDIGYPAGPRCTPTVDGDKVFTLGAVGDLICFDAANGTVIWQKNLPRTFKAPLPVWGYAGHPLVYKNLLICMAGGKESAVVALDKATGEEVWKSLNTSNIEYSPPTLIEAGGVTQLLIFHGKSLNGLNPETGAPYWSAPISSMAIMAPRQGDGFLFAGGHNRESIGLKLDPDKPAVTTVWTGARNLGLAPVSGTPFVEQGIAYGIDGNGVFRAMRIATGEQLWGTSKPVNGKDDTQRGPHAGAAFVTKNGNRFFIFGENGDLVIAKLSPEKYEERSRTKLLDPVGDGPGREVVWSHPAYADKCVFARNEKEIVCAYLAAE